jgi:hypothetical protein
MSVPLTRPTTMPVATAISMPTWSEPWPLITYFPIVTIERDIEVPTDRSMPPLMTTSSTPMASIPHTAAWRPRIL